MALIQTPEALHWWQRITNTSPQKTQNCKNNKKRKDWLSFYPSTTKFYTTVGCTVIPYSRSDQHPWQWDTHTEPQTLRLIYWTGLWADQVRAPPIPYQNNCFLPKMAPVKMVETSLRYLIQYQTTPLYSGTGWTRKLWSKTNLLEHQK